MNKIYTLLTSCFILLCTLTLSARHYHVAKTGDDANPGTKRAPFLTINHIAKRALPGDIITVHEGIYREWVQPLRGGTSENQRITYQAAPGEDVRILGSETAEGWVREGDLWKLELDDAFFGEFNPFKTLTRHPEHVAVDESGDGWGWLKYGRWTHLGDIIVNGEGLTEKQTPAEVNEHFNTWHVESEPGKTILRINIADLNPKVLTIELNARPYAFFPKLAGLNFITVRGFTFMNVACHWAPPTVYQPGALGPNGGHHWIIEDNIILYAKAAAISLGIPTQSIPGKIRGHHIVRNNVIMRCGQGGTTGQLWNSNSQIIGNHIEDINYRREFGGWETAAIKHHDTQNLLVKHNYINGVFTLHPDTGAAHGIWNDYRNTNWQVLNNVILDTESHSILSEANWDGPNLYLNNVIINGSIGSYSTRGDAWVHNLCINAGQKWENQPWGDRTQIGNARWFNNLFVSRGLDTAIIEDGTLYEGNVSVNGAQLSEHDPSPQIVSRLLDYRIMEHASGVDLHLSLEPNDLGENHAVDMNRVQLPFSVPLELTRDFHGDERTATFAGPFSNPMNGDKVAPLWRYPKSYTKAVMLLK